MTAACGALLLFPSESAEDVSSESRSHAPAVMTAVASDTMPIRGFVTRWVVPAATAFVFGSASVLVTVQMLDRRSGNRAAIDSPSLSVSDGLPPSLPASLDRIEVRPTVRSAAVASRSTSPDSTTGTRLNSGDTTIAPTVQRSESPDAIGVFPTATPQVIAPPSLIVQALTTLPGTEITDDEQAVGRVIRSYEEAYERVDAAAIVRLWQAVDRQALTQAFDAVTSQSIGLKNCAIELAGEQATARCRGTLKSVGKAGNAVTIASEQQWLFKMRREGGEWKIEDVSPSQTPPLVVSAGRGQN